MIPLDSAPATQPLSSQFHARQVTIAASVWVVVAGLALWIGAARLMTLWPLGPPFVVGIALSYLVGAALIVARIGGHHPHARFGLANIFTTCRLALASLFAGLVVEAMSVGAAPPSWSPWLFFALATAALVFDALDGIAARWQGLESAFGSRFDMEVDAALIFFMAVAALLLGKAGAWVLLSGGLRYLYVAAGLVWPKLTRPLAPSWRRKSISAVQSIALAALMAPIIETPLATLIGAGALALLVYSFAVDVVRQFQSP